MNIPSFTADVNLRTPQYAAESTQSAQSTGDAIGAIAGAGMQASRSAMAASDNMRAAKIARDRDQDLQWLGESASQFAREIARRQIQDAEGRSETQAEDFEKFSADRINDYSAKAPSPKAAELFRRHALQVSDGAYQSALQASAKIRLENSDISNRKTAENVISVYKDLAPLAGYEAAAAAITPLVTTQLATIEARYGQAAPKFAEKLKLDLLGEVILATGATNPKYAEQLISTAPISEEAKTHFGAQVSALSGPMRALSQDRLERAVEASIDVAARTRGKAVLPSRAEFESVYGERWQVAYERASAKVDRVNTANEMINSSVGEGANPEAIAAAAAKARASGDVHKVEAAQVLDQIAEASDKLRRADPAEWQNNNDPEIQLTMAVLSSMPEQERPQFMASLANQRIARQGYAPPNDPHPERYLNRDTFHILTATEVDARKRQINAAPPDEALAILDSLEAEFGGDSKLAAKAFSDMLELGKEKLSAGYRFASIINDRVARKSFFVSQRAAGPDKAIDETQRKEYVDSLETNKDWLAFSSAWLGESREGSSDVADSKTAIIAYATDLKVKHRMTPKEATAEAIRQVISANYGFAEINGRVAAVPRVTSKGEVRTDADIRDLGRRLGVALREIPLGEIQQFNPVDGSPYFPTLTGPMSVEPQKIEKLDGQITPGNIDLSTRPKVKNPDGTVSTVRSIGVNFDGIEYLIPTVSDDGKILSEDQAIELFKKTGKHLGGFNSVEASNRAAEIIHNSEARRIQKQPGLDVKNPAVAEALSRVIRSSAFWETDPSGEFATLKIAQKGMDGFNLLDKMNRPITVRFDNLPQFVERAYRVNSAYGIDPYMRQTQPSDSWVAPKGWGTTNLPGFPSWLIHE